MTRPPSTCLFLKFRLSLTPSADMCRGQSNCVSVGNKLSIGLQPIISPMTRHVCQRWLSSQSERNWWFGGRVICGAGGCVRASLAGRRIWEGRGKARSYSHWLPSYFVLFLFTTWIYCWNTERAGEKQGPWLTSWCVILLWLVNLRSQGLLRYFPLLRTCGGLGNATTLSASIMLSTTLMTHL